MQLQDKKKIQYESESLCKLCTNRKIQNFQTLKQWDQNRAYKLITHRKIADQIQQVLQLRITQSNQYLQVVNQYLSDVQNQLKKHQSQSVINPQIKLISNLISRNIQLTTSKILIRLYNKIENKKEEKQICALLEESRKKIQNILSQSNVDIMEIRIKIQMKIVQIQNQNLYTIQQCDRVLDTYNENNKIKIFYTQQDFFLIQQMFLQATKKQMNIQQSFGLLIVQLLQCVQQYQKDKLEIVRSILSKYLIALEQTSQINQNIKFLLDILEKRTEDSILNAFYSSEEFISQQMIKDLRKLQQIDENQKIDLKMIKNFLTKIPYYDFNNRNLILKEYKTYIQIGEQLENSYLIITVDAFLHIYQYKDNFQLLELQPEYSFKCNNNLQMRKQGDVNLYIEVKKWQLGNLTKQSIKIICIVFLSQDHREEFREFIGKIIL